MSNKFYGTGNLGADPELKQLEDGIVCNMRVYFDRPVPVKDEGFEDKGGFWLNVDAWDKLAQACKDILSKGTRVTIEGTLIGHEWVNDGGEEKASINLRAKRIGTDITAFKTLK